MKLNRAYTHRFSKLATEFGCKFDLDENASDVPPYLLTPMLNPDTMQVAATVAVQFLGETPWDIETAAALHREVWRGIVATADHAEEVIAMASAVARAHDVATAELRAGTLPGVDA
jgi:hypothetical protein